MGTFTNTVTCRSLQTLTTWGRGGEREKNIVGERREKVKEGWEKRRREEERRRLRERRSPRRKTKREREGGRGVE